MNDYMNDFPNNWNNEPKFFTTEDLNLDPAMVSVSVCQCHYDNDALCVCVSTLMVSFFDDRNNNCWHTVRLV